MAIDAIALVGAGGHGCVVADAAERLGYREIVFYTEGEGQVGQTVLGHEVRLLEQNAPIGLFQVCIGHNKARARLSRLLLDWGCRPINIVHDAATVARSSEMGLGCFVGAGAVLAPRSVVGNASIINHGAIVDHDVQVGSHSHIAPRATLGGAVRVGNGVLIGAGAVVLPGVTIDDDATIGAGAVVLKDVGRGAIVVGVPARDIDWKVGL